MVSPFLVNVLRKTGEWPTIRHWLEKTVDHTGSFELSQAGTLRGLGSF